MRLLSALLLIVLAACGPVEERVAEAPEPTPAPAVVLPTADGPVDLASLAGRPVILQFADADATDAWAALGDALADLEAAGATVVTVTVGDAEADAARAFGYDGSPLAVVVDGEGSMRGSGSPDSGDALFALAVPVLAEADISASVSWPGADNLDDLVAVGGIVVDVSGGTAEIAHALRADADTLAADDLPADLGTPLAFVGDDAADAATAATRWGYAAVFIADADGALAPVEAPAPRRSGGVRG